MTCRGRVDVYSHGFRVSGYRYELIPRLARFAESFTKMEFERLPGGRVEKRPGDFFGGVSDGQTEYWFHRNVLPEFKRYMTDCGYSDHALIYTFHDAPKGEASSLVMREHFKPLDYQVPIVDFLVEPGKSIRVATMQTGKGKASSVNAKVKVPGGWKRMGDIKVGDRVTTWDGTPTEVLGVYPQGVVPTYKVGFEDGRKTVVCGEHLWEVWIDDVKQILTTLELWAIKDKLIFVRQCQSEQIDDVDYGDRYGCLYTYARKCVEGLPEELLHGSDRQRRLVLQGLLDSGALVGIETRLFVDRKRAEQVQYLYRSLGKAARLVERFVTPNPSVVVYEVVVTVREFEYGDCLRLTSITPHAKEEAQCISVAHPDRLYVTDDFIVTHNTKTSLFAAAKIGEKFAVVVPAMYADMWYTELETVFHHKRGDILLIKGLKALKAALLTKASGENHASAYVITSTTIMLLIKAYESNPKFAEETVCRPEELYALLGLGYRVIDEVHKNSALNFKMDCYTNITKAVYLSATLDANEAFLRRMRQIAYPMNDRYDGLEYDRYINVVGLAYHADEPRKIRCKGYKGAYSHVVFEQWLMKNKRSLEKYMTFLDEIVLRKYIQVREPGQRCLVFASSVDFCTLYMKRLRAKYPQLKIGRYTQEDVYDDMLTNDITVSTVLSAGTGVDIPGLRIAIMSNSMDSPSANEQVKGRLRRLKDWPDVNPEFYYIFCSDIPKHVDYHNRKMDYFKGKCLSHLVYNSGYSI